MPSRYVTLVLIVVSAVAFVACSDADDGGADGDGLTAELAVPPAKQVAAATVAPTATQEPTPTPEPTVVAEPTAINRAVNIPNRGYNSLGDPDAPITMFDFSDFL